MSEIDFFSVIVEKDEILLNSSKRKDSVVISKMNFNISQRTRKLDFKNKRKYFSVLGAIEAAIFDYLILVSKVEIVGKLFDAHIFKVEEVISFSFEDRVRSTYC